MENRIDRLKSKDLEYTENFLKELYNAEIDRKDKILSSMSVISLPVTALIGAVTFLISNAFDDRFGFITSRPDVVVITFFLLMAGMFSCMFQALYNLHLLLSGENYKYLPDAAKVLQNIADIRTYCENKAIFGDGSVSDLARTNFIGQYAECARNNCYSNDIRLKYRQKVFRSTVLAVILAACSFPPVAIHRERPHIWDVSTLWRRSRGSTSQDNNSTPSIIQPPNAAVEQSQSKQPAPAPAPSGH